MVRRSLSFLAVRSKFSNFARLIEQNMEQQQPILIDVERVVRAKIPGYARFIPGFVYRYLEHVIRQKELNRILKENYERRGHEFAEGTLTSLGMKLNVVGADRIPDTGRYIFASNHPLGGLDGIALIALLGERYGGNVRCIVNDLLMAIEPMRSVFLPINKHGRQSRESAKAIEEAYASDCQMIMFPAGLCSRMGEGGRIADLEWQKSFIAKSREYQRDIIPIYFGGLNSKFFYKFAKLRQRMGIKLNIEMVRLPAELVRGAGGTLNVVIGEPISYAAFDSSKTPQEWAQEVKRTVYGLANELK